MNNRIKYKHIKASKVPEISRGSIVVQNLFPNDDYKKFSVAKIQIVGKQKFGYSKERDAVYYVLEGSGEFFIEDEKFTVEKGDLVFIPKGVKYKDSGRLTLLSVSVPKFDIDKWVIVEDAE